MPDDTTQPSQPNPSSLPPDKTQTTSGAIEKLDEGLADRLDVDPGRGDIKG